MKFSIFLILLFTLVSCTKEGSTPEIESGKDLNLSTLVKLRYQDWYEVPSPHAGLLRGYCFEKPEIGCEIEDDPLQRECSFECAGPVIITLKDNEWACDESFWNVPPELYSVLPSGEFFYQSSGKEQLIEIEAGDIICD